MNDFGYNKELENYKIQNKLEGFLVARVIAEHKERYIVTTGNKEFEAEILGNLRFAAQSRADFPAVGDWVAISEYDEDKALIHQIFPRKSVIERQTVGKSGEKQIIAANIDTAFIVLSVDRDFSVNRIERYLTICNSGNVNALVLLNKTDLVNQSELDQMIDAIHSRHSSLQVLPISNESKLGLRELKDNLKPEETYCLLGSSGVGKSTILNSLLGSETMRTDIISASTQRGKHITTYRELKVLENGAIVIDNPGMREIGMTDSSAGLDMTFDQISELAQNCRYQDCTHTTEKGCAVLAGVDEGKLSAETYENYLRMKKEATYFESSLEEKKRKDKDLGKLLKNYKKDKFGKYNTD